MKVLAILILAISVAFCEKTLDMSNIFGVPVKLSIPATDEYDIGAKSEAAEFIRESILNSNWFQPEHFARFVSLYSGDKNGVAAMTHCQNDTLFLLDSLTNNDTTHNSEQAMRYIDSMGKIPAGIFSGNWLWLGDYEECSSILYLQNLPGQSLVKAKHFLVAFTHSDGTPLFGTQPIVTSFCLPDKCSKENATALINTGIQYMKLLVKQLQTVDIVATATYKEHESHLDGGAKAFLVITGILCTLVLLGTVADYFFAKEESSESRFLLENYDEPYAEQSDIAGLLSNDTQQKRLNLQFVDGKLLDFCKAFSLYSNSKKLFGTNTAEGPLACLNGLRVLSMWWVILGHNYAFITTFLSNSIDAYSLIERFTFQPIANGTYSVDSFFFLSGLLVAYLAFKELNEKGSLNWFYFIVHRYWRLTPLYAFVIFYFAYVMKYTISEPFNFFMEVPKGFGDSAAQCKKYWWTNLLYINNFYPDYGSLAKSCLGWGWYLANDMQFYVILGPAIVILIKLNKKAGIAVAVMLILACIGTRVGLVIYYGVNDILQAVPNKHQDDNLAKNGVMYQRPYTRSSVYIVGMLTGYLLAQTSNRIRIHRLMALLGWCIAIASGLSVIYGMYYYNHRILEQTHMTMTASAFYLGLGRTTWGICLAWVVLACVSGNGTFITDILSWKIWAPLGRLTYAAYLVHPIVIYTFALNLPDTIRYSDLLLVYLFVSNLVFSYIIAFCVSMLVEAPMIQLEKLVLVPGGRKIYTIIAPIGSRITKVSFRRNQE